MTKRLQFLLFALAAGACLPAAITGAGPIHDVPLTNPHFTGGLDGKGVPTGWSRYGSGGAGQELRVVDGPGGRKALLISDGNPDAETGVVQNLPLKGGETYRVTAQVCGVEESTPAGAYLQFRFLPSQEFAQAGLAAESAKGFSEVELEATAPPGTTGGIIYLYTHRSPTPRVLVTGIRVQGGLPPPPPPPPPPAPPQVTRLKDLHLDIRVVHDGRASATIVASGDAAGRHAAEAIQREIKRRTGVLLPMVPDSSPEAAVPPRTHLILVGNRSTNAALRTLYDRFYCLADLKYPGPEGYAIRSVHNPFGNGSSLLIIGASDDAGVAAGAAKFVDLLSSRAKASPGELSLGWTMETKLGRGVKPPAEIRDFEVWEASKGYGSIGYFGWSSISKRMAMYYMTGDEFSAREVVRLAFPDAKAIRDIEQIDGERIENKRDPLAGFYHYNAHLAILFWDLIEESPVFTGEERLAITNAFARQLNHRKDEGIYRLTRPPSHGVGTRHGQWSAISLYCLGRYFQTSYPHPVWAQCLRGGELAFHSLHKHAWVAGESDNLFWYSTGMAPILTYMVLTGDRRPLENGVLPELLRGQEILISGRVPDWALNSAALDFLNKAAYLTGDGRWAAYRNRTGVDTEVFRLGQSFWPEPALAPAPPADLAGKWSVHRLPRPAWEARASGLPYEHSFYFASYRSAPDAAGDFLLLDGFNGASRNPYHTFGILELRLAGRTLLQGYHNQVLTSADGMVEPAVAMDAALLHADVVGGTALAVGEVPRAAFCNWRRSVCQRTGRYALIVDDLTFRADSRNMKVTTTWQAPGGNWNAKDQALRFPAAAPVPDSVFELRSCDVQGVSPGGPLALDWTGAVKPDAHRKAFHLLAPASAKAPSRLACLRLTSEAAVLALPRPALCVAGEHGEVRGELVIVAEDHLFGHALTRAAVGGVELMSSDAPVELDWDFASGSASVAAARPVRLRLGTRSLSLAQGRHLLAIPGMPASRAGLAAALQRLLAEGQRHRQDALEARAAAKPAELPDWTAAWVARLPGKISASAPVRMPGGPALAVAHGSTIHLLTSSGQDSGTLQTDGPVRVLRWWEECGLLLAGCADEKVIAFDRERRRAWAFTSEMDPAVYEAAKDYWFKSAPGHEGIHGLATGLFDGGKPRCFAGSVCTLEVLDPAGKLVKRTPVFWGPCWKFLLSAGKDGSPSLLIAQWPNGNDGLAIVDSRSLSVTGHGFQDVPSGHSFVGGWTAQNRTGLVRADMDGDGRPEIVTGINGTWNRVTVYSEEGKPLANAQFGPGASAAPRSRLRDLAVADLNGDGKLEIVVGVSEGLVVALSHTCQKLWSTRLPSAPVSLRCTVPAGTKRPLVITGCEDGRVMALDSFGNPVRMGRVNGETWQMEELESPAGPVMVLLTDQGEVKAFATGQLTSQSR